MSDLPVVPHGAWPSAIDVDLVAAGGVSLSQVEMDDGGVLWVEGRPAERGRCVVVRRTAAGRVANLTPRPYNARSRVHEYGGGAYAVRALTVVFSNLEDQRLYRQDSGGAPRAITPAPSRPGALGGSEL